MFDDNVMPNDGTYFGVPLEPADQAIERKKERAKTLEVLPILNEMLAQLEFDIAFYQNVKSIPDEVKVEPDKFLIMHNAHELVSDILMAKKSWIEGLIENTKKR